MVCRISFYKCDIICAFTVCDSDRTFRNTCVVILAIGNNILVADVCFFDRISVNMPFLLIQVRAVASPRPGPSVRRCQRNLYIPARPAGIVMLRQCEIDRLGQTFCEGTVIKISPFFPDNDFP